MVVRFNGGAQAGHTVVTPDGRRHVFHHLGAGTFAGVPTYLSKYFICNPLLFFQELDLLHALGVKPVVYAHPECLVTTFADMLINQRLEDKLGTARHGSCGVGINETVIRSGLPHLRITMADLWNRIGSLEGKLHEICQHYAEFRTGAAVNHPEMHEWFMKGCWRFAEVVSPLGIQQCRDPVFEGAQGLLLDQNNREFFPHLTRSNTGLKNVRTLCVTAGIDQIDAYYVSRTYLTRHGAGKLPGEDVSMRFEDDTNTEHDYQGTMRFAPMDWAALVARMSADCRGANYHLAVTHMDQHLCAVGADLFGYGPGRADVRNGSVKKVKVGT